MNEPKCSRCLLNGKDTPAEWYIEDEHYCDNCRKFMKYSAIAGIRVGSRSYIARFDLQYPEVDEMTATEAKYGAARRFKTKEEQATEEQGGDLNLTPVGSLSRTQIRRGREIEVADGEESEANGVAKDLTGVAESLSVSAEDKTIPRSEPSAEVPKPKRKYTRRELPPTPPPPEVKNTVFTDKPLSQFNSEYEASKLPTSTPVLQAVTDAIATIQVPESALNQWWGKLALEEKGAAFSNWLQRGLSAE